MERHRAELLLAGGASIRAVANKFKLPYPSLARHWKMHVSEQRKAALVVGPVARQALAARVQEESSSVIDHLRAIRSGLYQLYDAAIEAGDRSGGALLAGRLIECCSAVGKITGELAQSPLVQNQTNVFIGPQFAQLQAVLIRALTNFPDARAAVVREFRELEARAKPPPLIEHENGQAPSA